MLNRERNLVVVLTLKVMTLILLMLPHWVGFDWTLSVAAIDDVFNHLEPLFFVFLWLGGNIAGIKVGFNDIKPVLEGIDGGQGNVLVWVLLRVTVMVLFALLFHLTLNQATLVSCWRVPNSRLRSRVLINCVVSLALSVNQLVLRVSTISNFTRWAIFKGTKWVLNLRIDGVLYVEQLRLNVWDPSLELAVVRRLVVRLVAPVSCNCVSSYFQSTIWLSQH